MFEIKFYGCRGSSPVCRPEVMKYGGNTTCILLNMGEKSFIVDCGTGLLNLPMELAGKIRQPIDIFLTHIHWDHIQAIAFFPPFFNKQCHFRIYAEKRAGEGLENQLSRILNSPMFPIKIDAFQAKMEYREIKCGYTYEIEGIIVQTIRLRHPNICTGYRFSYEGKSVCIISDFEHASNVEEDNRYVEFARNCDFLIYDAQYTNAEYPEKKGWGHSTWEKGIEMAERCGCKKVCLTHHDLLRKDCALDEIACQAQHLFPSSIVAQEGMCMEV